MSKFINQYKRYLVTADTDTILHALDTMVACDSTMAEHGYYPDVDRQQEILGAIHTELSKRGVC